MKKTEQTQRRRRIRTILYLYVLLVLLSLFSVATYTWFSISRTPEVSDMAIYVNSPTGLELSADPTATEWKLQLNMADLCGESAPLRPITWSDMDKQFFAATYGIDGRLTNIWEPLTDSRNANKDNADGYYMKGVFYARCEQKVEVYLSSAVEVEEGRMGAGTYVIGTPIWNPETISHDNGSHGAELAIRIGLLIEKTDLEGKIKEQEPAVFYIYEPNFDKHIDNTEGDVPTPSKDGTESLVSEDFIIKQTMNSWMESDPVQNGVVVRSLGEFTTDTTLFTITNDELARISLYVWLEGQDKDCTNAIGHESHLQANVQFATKSDGQSGLHPIE